MRHPRLLLFSTVIAAGSAAVFGLTPSGDIDKNRDELRKCKAEQPEEYARIRRNYVRLQSLPASQVERIRQLDLDLHKDSRQAERLGRVLDEYAAWLTRLPAGDRERIDAAVLTENKLRIIREIKERQWFQRLPRAYQEQYSAAKADKERQELLQKWRQQEREFEDAWTETQIFAGGMPNKRPMLPFMQESARQELFNFVQNRLYPMLSDSERKTLDDKWQEYEQRGSPMNWLRTVHELSERHPVLSLEPKYANYKSLPLEYQRAIEKLPKFFAMKLPENRWPQYPIEVTNALRKAKMQPRQQLGPATAREISDRVDAWVQKELWPKLLNAQKARLKEAEGKWPDYPLALHEVARAHHIAIPEMDLPGDPRIWEWFKQRPMMMPGPGPRKKP